MSDNMVVQIGNIVANALIKNESIHLPTVGSLYVDKTSSKLTSSGKVITPPQHIVKFSSSQIGVSIVEIISFIGKCDTPTAETIYSQWLDRVKIEGGLEIAGVGLLKNKNFKLSESLRATLNPEIYKELRIKKRNHELLLVTLSIVLCVCVGVGVHQAFRWFSSSSKTQIRSAAIELPHKQKEVVAEVVQVDSTQDVVIAQQPIVEVKNPRYRLVYGVFSTKENANKAVSDIARKSPDIEPTIRPYGDLFMVNLMESDAIIDCKKFMEQNKEDYPELWISKRRGE